MITPTRRDWPSTLFYFAFVAAAGAAAITWITIQVIAQIWHVDMGAMDALRVAMSAIADPTGEWRVIPIQHRVYVALPLVAGTPLMLVIAWIFARAGGVAPPAETQTAGKILSDDEHHAARTARRESASQRGGDGLNIHPAIRISRDRETRGIGVVGSIGGGKTTVLQPLITAALERGDRAIVLDIKGDYTAGLLGQPGVATLSPWDSRAIAWDVATDIDTTSAAEEFAARVIPTAKGDNPMWANGARAILAGAIISQMRGRARVWTLADVGSLITSSYTFFRISVIAAYPACGAFLPEKPTNTTTSFLANLAAFLTPVYKLGDAWSYEGHGKLPEQISLRDWIRKPAEQLKYQCLIMGSHGAHEQTARALAQAVLGYLRAIVASPDLPDDPDRRIWLFLDEFPQLGKIEGFERFVEIGRSKGVCVVFGAQDIAQIRTHYGPEIEKTWTGSVGTWIIARSQGPETQSWCQKMVGDARWERASKSTTRGSFLGGAVAPTETTSTQPEERPVIRTEQFGAGMGPIADERGFWSRLFGAPHVGVRAHLYCPDWSHIYRLDWPYSSLPGGAAPVSYAPWALPGWPDSSAAAQAALTHATSGISPDAGDPPASDENDDSGAPIKPPTPPSGPAAPGAAGPRPADPVIDPDLLPIFDDLAAPARESEAESEGALAALGAKAAEDAAEGLIADTLGDDVVGHAAELLGHAIDVLDSASPGNGEAPRIVTRADAIRARREARRAQEQEQEPQDDGPEPGP